VALGGHVSESGEISLPLAFLEAIGLDRNGDVVIELDGQTIRIRTVREVVARAQAVTRAFLGDGLDTGVDAFLAERRRDAERE
jgi:antitoxin component of MazEF toxin-antitoxin module